jgi:RNA polymerase sigma-70 factor (ECF subfamily)
MADTAGPDPDAADVRSVRAGNTEAFEGIVRRWQGPLVTLAYRYCRNRAQAEEMAQEAFLRAYRFLDRWKEDAPFKSWLFAVAANVYRSQLRRHRPPEVSLDALTRIAAVTNPSDSFEADDLGEAVRRTVTRLPAKYRDAVILFYFQEMDTAEVARTLGLPEGTLKARLHRGRALLQRKLITLLGSPRRAEAT